MTSLNAQKVKAQWDQSGFESLQSSWTTEQAAANEKRLKEIFELAADSPTAKQALDWANQHGVKFAIDWENEDMVAHYEGGTGIVTFLDKRCTDPEEVVHAIAHEPRHAWHDYHGLIPNVPDQDFATYFIKTSLVEADGYAFGKRAMDEYKAAQSKETKQPVDPALVLSSEDADLRESFLAWFSRKSLSLYGDHYSRIYESHSKAGTLLDPSVVSRLNVTDIESIVRLGEGFFGGRSYLAKMPKEILFKKVLSPSLANIFYGAATDNQTKMTANFRKSCLRKKLSRFMRPSSAAKKPQLKSTP